MRINANIAAINASRNLSVSNSQLGKSLEKLSSGFRINRAADDAAGLAISEGLRSEIRGSAQAQRNAQDGISFLQTAEGALNEVHSMLQRVRELAVQAANGTSDGTAEQAETTALLSEITAIGARTRFSGISVFADFSGVGAGLNFQVSANSALAEQVTISNDLVLDTTVATGLFTVALSGVSLTTDAGARTAIDTVGTAIDDVSTVRGTLGAVQNRLEHTVSNLGVAVENLTASESRIRDVDMAAEMVTFTRNSILSQAGTAMLAQANQVPQGILALLR
ncbi:MAG: flagellin [Actinobacteria bacterium]|nr:flagellin [Actinomycetota bacterium]